MEGPTAAGEPVLGPSPEMLSRCDSGCSGLCGARSGSSHPWPLRLSSPTFSVCLAASATHRFPRCRCRIPDRRSALGVPLRGSSPTFQRSGCSSPAGPPAQLLLAPQLNQWRGHLCQTGFLKFKKLREPLVLVQPLRTTAYPGLDPFLDEEMAPGELQSEQRGAVQGSDSALLSPKPVTQLCFLLPLAHAGQEGRGAFPGFYLM